MTDAAIIILCIAFAIYFVAKARKLWHEATEIRLRTAERVLSSKLAERVGRGARPQ